MVLKKYDQDQSKFICFNPKSNIPEGHIAFLVDEIVEGLDFGEINGKYEGTPGAHAYNRKIALKIDIMGVVDSIFSSRKICEQLMYNDVYKYLAGNEIIDHRTLCRSRKENEDLYKKALLSTIIIGIERKMITLEHIGLDGTLYKANASIKNLFTAENLKVVDEIIAKRLSFDEEDELFYQKDTYEIVEKDYFNAIDEILKDDLIENTINEVKTEKEKENHGEKVEKTIEMRDLKKEKNNHKRISNKIKKTAQKILKGDKKTIEKKKKVEEKLEESIQEKVNMTDPDSFAAYNKKKCFESLYNIGYACDYDSKMILANIVGDTPTDANQFIPLLEELIETIGIENINTISADSIYNNSKNLIYAEKQGINALIPSKFQASTSKDDTYKEKNQFHKHNFIYNHEKDCYICPMDIELPFKNEYKDGKRVYYTNECKNCIEKDKCKKKSGTRIITAYKGEQAIQRMKIKMEKPENQKEYKKRAPAVESPIGDIKHNNHMREFKTRGNEKVLIEANKGSISHNLRLILSNIKKQKKELEKVDQSITKQPNLSYKICQKIKSFFKFPQKTGLFISIQFFQRKIQISKT